MIEPIKEQLRKIKRLADSGVGGERDVAARKLSELMQKHGLTLQDLEGSEKKRALFKAHSATDRQLLFNVIFMVTKTSKLQYGQTKGKSWFWFELTRVEYQDAIHALEHYRREWRKEQKKMMEAFIYRHQIFNPERSDTEADAPEMSLEEMEALLRRMSSLESKPWQRPTERLEFGGVQ